MKKPLLAGNRNAAKPAKLRRVVLPAQRVAPETLATLKRMGRRNKGIGRAIDVAVAAYEQYAAQLESR